VSSLCAAALQGQLEADSPEIAPGVVMEDRLRQARAFEAFDQTSRLAGDDTVNSSEVRCVCLFDPRRMR
jgi:hypothetical protein